MSNDRYIEIFTQPLRVCKDYKPKFGNNADEDTTLDDFRRLYGSDPLYYWVGFDSDLMYAAHKAAGGITSVYRQLGIGCERLLRCVMQDAAALTDDDVTWSFQVEKEDGSLGTLKLDAYLPLNKINDAALRRRISNWLHSCADSLALSTTLAHSLEGAVFEIRQGYKSADSKRQNADLRFALRAYGENVLPVMMLASSQVNSTVLRRYRSSNLLVLIGSLDGDSTKSTYAFYRDVIGYDLAAFFERHSATLRQQVQEILSSLLTPG